MVEMVKCTLNGKYEIILPKHRAERPEWYSEGGWEKERLERMHSTTVAGDVVYYVGAEEGDMCGLLAKWGAQLVLFEPNDRVWPNIKVIWEANELKAPLACFPGFASNKTTNLEALTLGWPSSADGEVIGDHGFKELAAQDPAIPQVKIDDLVGVPPPDMISLDVEGSEFEVLRGAEQTLRKYRPRIFLSLHPEFMFNMFGEYGNDLRQWIKNIGYTEHLLAYAHEVHLFYD